MKLKIEFDCDNAAFDDQPEIEIARILRELSDRIQLRGLDVSHGKIRDVNGNVVGAFDVIG